MVDGEVAYILSFTVPLSRLQGILAREVVQGWTTGISDRNGTVLARLPDPTSVVGRPRLATLRQIQTATTGVWEGQDRQRRPVVVIEARSRLTGWTVATSIPQTTVDARVRRWVWAFAGFGLLVLATSSVLAVSLWSRVTRPLRMLAASGPALARGEGDRARPLAGPRDPAAGQGALRCLPAHPHQGGGARPCLEDTQRGLSALRESEARFRHMADSAPP